MRVAAAEAYQAWSQTYDTAPNPIVDLESATLSSLLEPLQGKTFVDIGCGTGRWIEHARSQGARILGLDPSPEMLRKASERPALPGNLIRADAVRLPLAAGIADIVVCSFAIAYADSLEDSAAEMNRISRPGARIFVTDLHPQAVAAGWKRSFRQGDRLYDLEHSVYREDELIEAFTLAGLTLERATAVHFDERQRDTFRRAGKEHVFEETCRVPAVWLTLWRKP